MEKKGIEQIVAFTQFPLHTDAELLRRGMEQSLDRYEALSDKFMTFLRDTKTTESECELAAHIMVNKPSPKKIGLLHS